MSFSTEAPEAYLQGDSHPSAESTCALALLKHSTLHMASTLLNSEVFDLFVDIVYMLKALSVLKHLF